MGLSATAGGVVPFRGGGESAFPLPPSGPGGGVRQGCGRATGVTASASGRVGRRPAMPVPSLRLPCAYRARGASGIGGISLR